uniref:Protein kinase domain-containing protein n=2 Tax=Anopheles funestus TaxID=62324 RepID=A0A182RCG4_ANOFN
MHLVWLVKFPSPSAIKVLLLNQRPRRRKMAGQLVSNPINCTDIVTMEIHSKLRSVLGWKAQITLGTINRPRSTTASSPWDLKNLCKRVDHQRAIRELVEEELDVLRHLTHLSPFPPALLMGEICRLRMIKLHWPRTLADVLSERYRNQQGPLEPAKALKVVVMMLHALKFNQEKLRLIHGDVKSFNILIENDFEVAMLSGYGAKSKIVNSSGNYERGFNPDEARNIGIGLWSAPEALSTGTGYIFLNCKVDIFSLGMVVYEMLACMPPHTFPGIKDTGILETEELLKTVDFYNKERAALYRAQTRNKPRSVARMSTAPYCPPPKPRVIQKEKNRTNAKPSPSSRTKENRDIQSIMKLALDKKKEQSTSTDGKVAKATQTEPRPAELPDCLNYAALGTRPLLPSMLGKEYELLFQIFYVCTERFDPIRPTARELLNALVVVEESQENE